MNKKIINGLLCLGIAFSATTQIAQEKTVELTSKSKTKVKFNNKCYK